MDFRIRKWVNAWLDTRFTSADLRTYQGAAKGFMDEKEQSQLIEAIDIAVQKHQVTKVVLCNHEDCGAYGGSKKFSRPTDEQDFHAKELSKAHDVIYRCFPSLEIELYFIRVTPVESPHLYWECRPMRIEVV